MIAKARDDTLGFNLYRAGVLLRREFIRALAAYRMTPEQWQVMVTLWTTGRSLSQREIVELTLKDRPTISRMLRRMERDGWVERRSEARDARLTLVQLTPRGRQAQAELLGRMNDHFWRLLRPISREEKQTLTHLLRRLRSVLGDPPDQET